MRRHLYNTKRQTSDQNSLIDRYLLHLSHLGDCCKNSARPAQSVALALTFTVYMRAGSYS
jgi:hypothetical protein